MADQRYTVLKQENWSYLDALGNPIQGFRVTFRVNASGEVFFVNVPRLDAALVKTEIDALLKAREAVAAL